MVRLIAAACAEAGLLALRFDLRGVGGSEGESTAGTAEWDDVAAAVDALAELLPPGAPAGLAGYSFGAWLAAHHAARDDRVAALALVAPPPAVGGIPLPADALRGRPALAVAAEQDEAFPPESVARSLARLGGGRIERIQGADHLLHGAAERVAALVAGFLERSLPA